MIIDLLQRDARLYAIIVGTTVLSIVLHELGHAFAAIRQGDDTPRLLGHLTWNPVVHMGWFSLALVAIFGIGFGQTPVNPARFRSRHGDAIVSFAGPAVNLVLGAAGATAFALWLRMHPDAVPEDLPYTAILLFHLAMLNVVLLLLNLLPVPPLDGSHVAASLSPAYRDFVRNPDHQPFVTGALILVFVLGGRYLFPVAEEAVGRYVGFLVGLGR